MKTTQAVIGLVIAENISFDGAFRNRNNGNDIHHACEGITAIHKRSGAFEDLCFAYIVLIYLDPVLIAPLLSFLTDTIIHDHHPVIPEAADNRLGDSWTS